MSSSTKLKAGKAFSMIHKCKVIPNKSPEEYKVFTMLVFFFNCLYGMKHVAAIRLLYVLVCFALCMEARC